MRSFRDSVCLLSCWDKENKNNVEIDGQLSAIQSNRQTNGQSDRGGGEYGRTDRQIDTQTSKQKYEEINRQTEGHPTYRCQLL